MNNFRPKSVFKQLVSSLHSSNDASSSHDSLNDDSIHFPLNDFVLQEDDEHQNPNLFREVYLMAFSSAAIFVLADVRAAAREGVIELPEDIRKLPTTAHAILRAYRANEERLDKILREPDRIFLKNVSARMETDPERKDITADERLALLMLNQCTFEYFGDDNAESDCVYLILRNSLNKRITVCFRGSITLQDWIKDSKVIVNDIANPVSDRPGQPSTIGVHLGFREYLYGKSSKISFAQLGTLRSSFAGFGSEDSAEDKNHEIVSGSWNVAQVVTTFTKWKMKVGIIQDSADIDGIAVDDNCGGNDPNNQESDSNLRDSESFSSMSGCPKPEDASKVQSRLDKILEEVKSIKKEYEDHAIYITGHSLGGALGLLTALEAGARLGTKGQPVTFVGIANPRAGTVELRDAIRILEKEGKLRCICVHGENDLVPMIPVSATNKATKRRFCQSGIELILSQDKFEMRYSPEHDEDYLKRVGNVIKSAHRIKERHHYLTYLKQLKCFESPLHELHLNDYYNKIFGSEIFIPSSSNVTPMIVKVKQDSQGRGESNPPDIFIKKLEDETKEHAD